LAFRNIRCVELKGEFGLLKKYCRTEKRPLLAEKKICRTERRVLGLKFGVLS
jgi:hypothetical protein